MTRKQVSDLMFTQLNIPIPDWLKDFPLQNNLSYPKVEDRMKLVIELSRLNIEKKTGGPFGAAIFNTKDYKMLAAGTNLVEFTQISIAHAEIITLMLAQNKTHNYDLGSKGLPSYELVTSTEPCSMCFGAIIWSGIRNVICGARKNDAESIGFDEGPKPENWVELLKNRNINVIKDVLRNEAKRVLVDYSKNGGTIYNAHRAANRGKI